MQEQLRFGRLIFRWKVLDDADEEDASLAFLNLLPHLILYSITAAVYAQSMSCLSFPALPLPCITTDNQT